MNRKRLYISGPMTGIPDYNYPFFNNVAVALRALGFDVVNPAELHPNPGSVSWEECLREDIAALMYCDTLVLLPGWMGSKGANLELQVAQSVGIDVLHYENFHTLFGGLPPAP